MKLSLIITSLIFALFIRSQGQNAFVKHLYTHQLEMELDVYFKQNYSSAPDSFNLMMLQKSLFFKRDSDIVKFSKRIPEELFIKDSTLFKQTDLYYLACGNTTLMEHWSLRKTKMISNDNSSELNKIWDAARDPEHNGKDLLMNQYSEAFNNYYKQNFKKPWKAAALSAMVPGLGKLYIHKKRTFLGNFLSNSICIAQVAESVSRFGMKHWYSGLTLSMAAVYYISNVYGSYRDCKVTTKMKKLSFLHEAGNFYSDYYHFN